MKPSLRLFANIKPTGHYLRPYAPTGLTGLRNHPSPRSSLIFLYQSTLHKLKDFPESSIYRKSTEALTKHRLNIVQATKPPGFEEWNQKLQAAIKKDPERFKNALQPGGFYAAQVEDNFTHPDDREWDGEEHQPQEEGAALSEEEVMKRFKTLSEEKVVKDVPQWEPEPPLLAEQYVPHATSLHSSLEPWRSFYDDGLILFKSRINEIEKQISGGLLEEVVEVAENELKLTYQMHESKVYVMPPNSTRTPAR